MNITVLNNDEEFIRFLDPDLCDINETIEKGGLRTLTFEYKFQDMIVDKELFKIGNKVWIYGDSNLADCLYVINTSVVQDIYEENSFSFECEEVLVELNYAPVFTQTELSSENGFTFSQNSGTNEYSVVVNWNALNYWFGEWFNIGVVQKCLSDYNEKISINGTMNLMTLLRYIEEETGNIFVTRYEKDCLNNTIHRYLDFLNPISVSKPWVLNLEYDFLEIDEDTHIYTSDDQPTTDDLEDVTDKDDIVKWETDYTPQTNIDPKNVQFRITNGLEVLGTNGLVYDGTGKPLLWNGKDIPSFINNNQSAIISLQKEKDYIGVTVNEKSYAILENPVVGDVNKTYTTIENTVTNTNKRSNAIIPDDSYFEIYDTKSQTIVFKTCINREIGHVHEEVLDFGFNLDNVELEIDETETYQALSPVISIGTESELSREEIADVIEQWRGLEVEKGETVPMIVEKITVKASTLAEAMASLGTSTRTNYWSRPYHPQDQIDNNTASNSTWEFYRGTAYWKAPFDKIGGEFHIATDAVLNTEYTHIKGRPDLRDDRTVSVCRPKTGNLETTMDNPWIIFNEVCNKLRDKQAPEFNLTVDVANLRRGMFNPYQLHDKVYVKIPDMNTLLTARVVKTTKEAHDVAKNTIELSNYSVNTVKQIQSNTFIEASNVSFKYPEKVNYTVRLVNMDYDELNPDSIQYPANKMIAFHLFKVQDGQSTPLKYAYSRVTNAYGEATVALQYDPGDYQLEISFGGDEEYLDCSMTIDINVSGTKQVAKTTTNTKTTKSKTTTKATTKKTTTNTAKKNTSTKTRVILGSPSNYIKKLALNIVGDSTGLAAAKKVVAWVDSHIKYEYYSDFHRSPDTVVKKGRGNCCDQARTVLTLCDAAGCTQALTLKYVHVSTGVRGHVFCKIITKSSGAWRYVDTCKAGGKAWGNYVRGYGSPPGHQTNYPTRPF